MTDDMVTGTTATETPPAPADTGPAEAIADWLREQLYQAGPYGDPCDPTQKFAQLYQEDYSQEDAAAPETTVICCTPDGRYWHATIAVTVVEQVERTWAEVQ